MKWCNFGDARIKKKRKEKEDIYNNEQFRQAVLRRGCRLWCLIMTQALQLRLLQALYTTDVSVILTIYNDREFNAI